MRLWICLHWDRPSLHCLQRRESWALPLPARMAPRKGHRLMCDRPLSHHHGCMRHWSIVKKTSRLDLGWQDLRDGYMLYWVGAEMVPRDPSLRPRTVRFLASCSLLDQDRFDRINKGLSRTDCKLVRQNQGELDLSQDCWNLNERERGIGFCCSCRWNQHFLCGLRWVTCGGSLTSDLARWSGSTRLGAWGPS